MKKQIRQNVFETNSSSTHSISIAKEDPELLLLDTTIIPDQDGLVELHGGEFGWEWCKYNDALTKANYCAVDVLSNSKHLEMFIKVIKEQTGAEEIKILCSDDYNKSGYSYIDHQSEGISGKAFESEATLKQFIFNKNSWLFTGNDNSEPDPTFYDVPVFKGGREVKVKYAYELQVEGLKKTTKFKTLPSEEELNTAFSALLNGVYLHETGFMDEDNSIMAQIGRDKSSCYEHDYKCSFTNKTVEFKKEVWNAAKKEYDKLYKDLDWQTEGYQKCKEIEERLVNEPNSPFVKHVPYKLIEL